MLGPGRSGLLVPVVCYMMPDHYHLSSVTLTHHMTTLQHVTKYDGNLNDQLSDDSTAARSTGAQLQQDQQHRSIPHESSMTQCTVTRIHRATVHEGHMTA